MFNDHASLPFHSEVSYTAILQTLPGKLQDLTAKEVPRAFYGMKIPLHDESRLERLHREQLTCESYYSREI